MTAESAQLEKAFRGSGDPRSGPPSSSPIVAGGVWWGVLGLDDFAEERDWGEAERDCLRAVADMLGASIARQRVQ